MKLETVVRYTAIRNRKDHVMSDIAYAPPSFDNPDGMKVIFVDFTHAKYRLKFDVSAHTATVFSEITFKADDHGLAAIILNQPVISARLDGIDVGVVHQESPDAEASFKVLSKPVSPGAHVLTIKSVITEKGPYGHPITWMKPGSLECIFNMSDLYDGGAYLGAFLPSNYCYDHFRMSFSVMLENAMVPHSVFSNGAISGDSPGPWEVEFPSFFTSTCPWFHLGPAKHFKLRRATFKSSDGREIPMLVYTKAGKKSDDLLNQFVESTEQYINVLESNFGPFPHGSVTIFAKPGAGRGGMEYAGATATKLESLRHELNHSYFARSAMPVNGNAGWIDEAIAEWEEVEYDPSKDPPKSPANLGNRSEYIRTTHGDAYSVGPAFLAHLDYVLRQRGDPDHGLKAFLAVYAQQNRHQSVTVKEFQELVEDFHGESLQQLFQAYVYSEPKKSEK